ncbi:hypothetical protein [Dyadobacter sp. CY343]|uniref:hypothetical protein n=1 Tax=Dyadobacter sp. CY343 TaxID=2907299 RepID=UPI001F4218B0|nr:hypothetical protein [Dyadobacter sp. CY343]MCE7058956.1 hypothetical protein [Dyadobacter sp. CY343]
MFVSVLKVILSGILAGFLLFAIPFLLIKALFLFLFIGLIFRLAGRRRHFRQWRRYEYPRQFQESYSPYPDKETLSDHFNQQPKQI